VKLTAFLGSPRAGGNTDILATHVLEGAKEAGFETEAVALRRLRIRPCTACERCWQEGRPCVFNDDMHPLYETIASTDVLLFATPVYWYALIEGKGAIIAVAYEEAGPVAAEPLIRMFELSFDYLGVHFIHRIVVDGVGPKGAILRKPDVLEQAYQVGRALISWFPT